MSAPPSSSGTSSVTVATAPATFARDAILSIAAHIAATSTPPPEAAAASNAADSSRLTNANIREARSSRGNDANRSLLDT